MTGFLRTIRFHKGKKTITRDVTALELGELVEKGWIIGDTLEVFDDGVDEEAFHRLRKKLKAKK